MNIDHGVAATGGHVPVPIVMTTITPTSPVASTSVVVASPCAEAVTSSPSLTMVSQALAHSAEARRLAGTILEVMAGVVSITDAALALGITQARYQQLELRAVTGLIIACEPRPPGPAPGAMLPAELERLAAERDRLKAEVARYQTLARIAQGAFGTAAVPAAVAPERATRELPGFQARGTQRSRVAAIAAPAAGGGKSRKKRTPTVRALRLAKRVRTEAPETLRGAASTASMPMPTLTPSSGG